MQQVLVTGANGFIGNHLCRYLSIQEISVRAAVRQRRTGVDGPVVAVGDIHAHTDWTGALQGVQCVVHLAGRAHVMNAQTDEEKDLYYSTNTQGTLHLAEEAARKGVQRFIFISTIKVNGEGRPHLKCRAEDKPAPQDDYARSKWAAEKGLWNIARKTGLEVVIIRPPLVYGNGVGGNFNRLLTWVKRGLPIPLKAVRNKRSLIYIENLCDLIKVCLDHPLATGRTLLVCDGQDVSTSELITLLGVALKQPARLIPVPLIVLKAAARLCGKGDEMQRLTEDLMVDGMQTRTLLEWKPPWTLQQGIERSVA